MADEKRLLVINLSIFIERFVSSALSIFLDIELKTSKTLSNKSSAFSFRQKLDLLTDIRATEKADVSKFQLFSEIRNQFAHNYDVHDFTTCLTFLDGAENFLRKNYIVEGLENVDNEEQLHMLYKTLFRDVMDVSFKILKKVDEKIINIGKEQGIKEAYQSVLAAMKEYALTDENFNEKYNKIIDETLTRIREDKT